MANIIFKYKGKNDLNLTREFNSTSAFVANKDDVKFNDTSNPFSDYLASSSCGSWTDDKIKILSLPHKGRLFYLTNPGGGTEVYADVTVGQEIVVRDMTDNKVLKFSAEGSSDGQYTGNYFTEFTFERYCGVIPSNVVSVVKLNMIDLQVDIFITDDVIDEVNGNTTFKLNVVGNTFSGYVSMTGEKDRWTIGATVDCNLGNPLFIPDSYNIGNIAFNATPITRAPGIYDFILSAFGSSQTHAGNVFGKIGFGFNTGFSDAICQSRTQLVIMPE